MTVSNLRARLNDKAKIVPDNDYYNSIPEEQKKREISELVDKYKYVSRQRCALSWQEIREMLDSNLVDIGSHTRSHPSLIMTHNKDAKEEIVGSKEDLEVALGIDIKHFSYPNGDYSQSHVSILKEGGYLSAVTVIPEINTIATNPYELRRIGIEPNTSVYELAMQITGLWHKLRLDYPTIKNLRRRGIQY